MNNWTRRDWYVLNLGFSACGALIGALTHSLALVGWNLFWIAYTLFMLHDSGK